MSDDPYSSTARRPELVDGEGSENGARPCQVAVSCDPSGRDESKCYESTCTFRGPAPAVRRGRRSPPSSRRRAPGPQPPTFKVRVDYVEVDAVVTDRQGSFVRDLKKEDFQVLEDGKPQAITDLHDRRHSDRAAGAAAVRGGADRARREDERAAVRRPRLRDGDRRSAHAVRPQSPRVKVAAQAVHRATPRRQRPDGGRAHRRPHRRATRSSPATSGCCSRRSTRRMGRKLESATAGQDRRVLQHAGHRARRATRSTIPTMPSAASTRASSLDTLRNVADWFGGGARPPQGDPVRQRGDRLRHQRRDSHNGQPQARRRCSTRRATRFARRRGRTSAIYGIDPRGLTDLGDETIEVRARSRTTRRSASARGSLQNELRLSQDSLRTLVRRDRRLRGRQPQRLHDRLRAHRRRTTARTTCSPTTRRTRSRGRSSTRSTSA